MPGQYIAFSPSVSHSCGMIVRTCVGFILSCLFTTLSPAGQVIEAFDAHLAAHPDGKSAFSFDRSVFDEDLSSLPIGVFDSGIGGLTVLEAILSLDTFHNDDLTPGPDGRPDFEEERFIYLGDQANMPYGNYSKVDKVDYLRELILKDAVFLLGNRYRSGNQLRYDKPPVKAIVIACNTATAYGYEDIQAVLKRWGIPIIVVGVVEAGARGLLDASKDGAIGVLATVGTCASEVYPRTIRSTLGRAGRGPVQITQFGSADLAAIIEGDPAFAVTVADQVAKDVRQLVDAHRQFIGDHPPQPLAKIMLGCTHFPLALEEIDAAFSDLRKDPSYAPFIAETREYINPAEWTARQLFRDLALAKLRHRPGMPMAVDHELLFISVPNPANSDAKITAEGALDNDYKYGRDPGLFIEDTIIVPMTRAILPEAGRKLVSEKLPNVWGRLAAE